MLKHSYVPPEFCTGITIPLLKDSNLHSSNIDNYGAILKGKVCSLACELAATWRRPTLAQMNRSELSRMAGAIDDSTINIVVVIIIIIINTISPVFSKIFENCFRLCIKYLILIKKLTVFHFFTVNLQKI